MKQLAKDVLGDVRRSVVNLLVVTLAPILWTGAATAAWWGSLLSLRESQISSIRYWSVFASATALIAVAWSLYIRTMRRARRLGNELVDARNRPRRFQDDCTLDEKTGMYRHKTKPGFFCVACAVEKDLESPMIASSEKDWGWNCPVESKHFVRGPAWKPHTPIVVRNRWVSGP